MKRRYTGLVLGVLAVVLLLGVSETQAAMVRGHFSCGEWVKARRINGVAAAQGEWWLLGYMSGLAMATGKDVLKETDGSSAFPWMDNYCRNNPLDNIADGGDALYNELVRKRNL